MAYYGLPQEKARQAQALLMPAAHKEMSESIFGVLMPNFIVPLGGYSTAQMRMAWSLNGFDMVDAEKDELWCWGEGITPSTDRSILILLGCIDASLP